MSAVTEISYNCSCVSNTVTTVLDLFAKALAINGSHQLLEKVSVTPWRFLWGKKAHGQVKLKTFTSCKSFLKLWQFPGILSMPASSQLYVVHSFPQSLPFAFPTLPNAFKLTSRSTLYSCHNTYTGKIQEMLSTLPWTRGERVACWYKKMIYLHRKTNSSIYAGRIKGKAILYFYIYLRNWIWLIFYSDVALFLPCLSLSVVLCCMLTLQILAAKMTAAAFFNMYCTVNGITKPWGIIATH